MEKLTTFEDLCAAIEKSDGQNLERIFQQADPSIFECHFHIEGDGYNGAIPGFLLQGIADFQTAVLRSCGMAAKGKNDLRALHGQNLWLTIEPRKGSLDLVFGTAAVIAVVKLMSNLTNNQRWAVIGLTILAVVGYYTEDYFKHLSEVKLKEVEVQARVTETKEREQTERERIQAEINRTKATTDVTVRAISALEQYAYSTPQGKQIIDTVHENLNSGTESIIRGATGATRITARHRVYTENDIKAIQMPESMPCKNYELEGTFNVVQINTENTDVWKVQLKDVQSGEKITANVVLADLFVEEERAALMFDYQRERRALLVRFLVQERSGRKSYVIDQLSPASEL